MVAGSPTETFFFLSVGVETEQAGPGRFAAHVIFADLQQLVTLVDFPLTLITSVVTDCISALVVTSDDRYA